MSPSEADILEKVIDLTNMIYALKAELKSVKEERDFLRKVLSDNLKKSESE